MNPTGKKRGRRKWGFEDFVSSPKWPFTSWLPIHDDDCHIPTQDNNGDFHLQNEAPKVVH